MLKIDTETKQINLTRGDIAEFSITAKNDDGTNYQFQVGDTIKLSIYEKKDYSKLILSKSVEILEASESATLTLTSTETKIGDLINKPAEYWYEVQLNEEQTIIGYDENGAKIFKLYPEGE